MSNEQYLKVAIAAAKQSGITFQQFFGKPKSVRKKNGNPKDLVTEVDSRIETQIRKVLAKHFPKHKIIGEEFGAQTLGKNDLVWIIDPIDATTNYIQGIPFCCISIALWDSKGPLVGVVYSPVLKQLFTAVRGRGAWLNSRPIKVSGENKLNNALGGLGWFQAEAGIKLFSAMLRNCRKLRAFACAALQNCYVASGNFDFHITQDIKIWDFAAAILVITESGGKISDITGKKVSLKTTSLVASNGKIHNKLLKILKKI